jgi:hypothetical protein
MLILTSRRARGFQKRVYLAAGGQALEFLYLKKFI